MVLESLFPEKSIENRPLEMLLVSAIVTAAAIFTSYFVFPKYAGIITPLLVAVGMAPLIYRIFEVDEEEVDECAEKKMTAGFFLRHRETLLLFSLLFLGSFLAIFLVAIIAPANFVDAVFAPQMEDINAVQSLASGSAVHPGLLEVVLMNNVKVMSFAFLLSFIFGTGAVFIMSWNASILAIYFANFARSGMYQQLLLTTGGILPHAIAELVAYFLAGIAGGILSIGMAREKWGSPELNLLLRDSLFLMAIAVAAVSIGAVIEVGV
ncbi:MAG: stage II sporulation protein M [Candidatus Aenigmatarchaeota archaeon]